MQNVLKHKLHPEKRWQKYMKNDTDMIKQHLFQPYSVW